MEKNRYQSILSFLITKKILFFLVFIFTSSGLLAQNKSAIVNVHVNCQTLGAKDLQVFAIGKGYSVMQTTNNDGDVTFTVTWSGNNTETFYFYVNAAYGDFNGPNNTAVAIVNVTNGGISNIQFVLNANSEKFYNISGKVYNASVGQSGVVVKLYRLKPTNYITWEEVKSTITDANGDYTLNNVCAIGIYKTVALKSGFQYAPDPYYYHNLTGNLTYQNFTSIQGSIARTISGFTYVYDGGQTTTPIPNTLIIVYNGTTIDNNNIYTTVLSGNDGSYSFIGFEGSSYTLVPMLSGYDFTSNGSGRGPTSYYTGVLGASNITQNFYGELQKYILSGTVYYNASPLPYTKVNLFQAANGIKVGNAIASFVTAANGQYQFLNVPGRSEYIIEPEGVGTSSNPNTPLAGYSFNPTQRSIPFLVGDQSGLNFSASKNTVKISGYLLDPNKSPQGVSNIIVNITGGATQQYSSQANGYYEFYVPARSNYTITPDSNLTGYQFVDAQNTSLHYKGINADTLLSDKSDQNFRADLQNYTISGIVLNDGNPMTGVTLNLSGTNYYGNPVNQSLNTGGDGKYSFSVGALGSYTITPSYSGSEFSPASRTFTSIVRNETQNFITTTNTKHVFGFVRLDVNNVATGVNGIPLTFDSGQLTFSTVTQNNGTYDGYYSIYLPANNTYRITPEIIPDNGYRFTYPATGNAYYDVGPLVLNENGPYIFNADTAYYTISGSIYGTGSEITRVTIVGESVNTYQDIAANGTYTFSNLLGLTNYTITPNSDVYSFDPPNRQFMQLVGDKNSQNFSALPEVKKYKIKGTITKPGSTTVGLENVVVTVTGGSTPLITATNPSGYYEVLVNAGGTYAVTPELLGYNFKFNMSDIVPVSTTDDSIVTNIRADSTVNFTSTYKKAFISGKVFHLGAPLENVLFKLFKKAPYESLWTDSSTTTNSNSLGEYSFINLDQRFDYKVVPTLVGYTFIPTQKVFLDLVSDKPNEDFSTGSNTYSLSGKVATSDNKGIQNVVIQVETIAGSISFTTSTQTLVNGNYSVQVPAGNTYRITPLTIPDNGFNYKSTNGGGLYRDVGPVSSDYINLDFEADTNYYTVTGVVSGIGTTTAKIWITDNNGFTDSAIVSNNQSYIFNLKGLTNYTIKPISAVYNFAPSERILTNLIGNKTGQDFTATQDLKTYTISGYIRRQDAGHVNEGVQNLIVELNNGTVVTTTTNFSGYYEFTVPAGSTYTIIPLVPPEVPDHGYTFSPNNIFISTPVSANVPDQNFTANLKHYTISGTIWNNGNKMDGVIVRLSDGTTNIDYTTGTVNAGEYKFENLDAHKNYTVTPLTSSGAGVGYTFVPITKTFNDLVGDKLNEDFATNSNTYKISGYVARNLSDLTTGVNGVIIALATTSGNINFSSTTTTISDPSDANKKGYYEFIVPAGNTYSITPLITPDQGYNYTPIQINTTTPLSADLPNQNFTANLNKYAISGKIWNNAAPMEGVVLTLKKNNVISETFTTLADGLYSFNNLDAHFDYEVIPAKAGFTFIPDKRTFLDLVGNKPGEDFVTGENTHKISGYVRNATNDGVANITINLITVTGTPSVNLFAVTGTNGYYEFTIPAGNTYKITPLISPDQGYNFTPIDITTGVIIADLPNQNFTANLNNYTISGYVRTSQGIGIQGVTVHCSGKPDVLTNANGFYTFTVQALGTYVISPEYPGLIFAPTFARFENLIGNKSQDFVTITERGQLSADPAFLAYGDVLVNRKVSKNVVLSNNGMQQIIISNILVSGDIGSFSLGSSLTYPIILAPGGTRTITVDFVPNSIGPKNGTINVYHDASTTNPLQVPLTGNGVSTFATLNLPAVIDFGTVVLGSGIKEQTIIVGNNSPFSGDNLSLSSNYFEVASGLFSVPTPFPIIIESGTTYPVVIRLNPNELGFKQNYLHIINSSANNQNARIEVRANIIQGDLIVIPSSIDFGKVTNAQPYKDTLVTIQNNSAQAITILQKYISGDTNSFSINNPTPIVLQPNQSDQVIVRFYPPTAGKKDGRLNIKSNYSLAPELFVPLTGIGGDQPIISSNMITIDFGTLRNGEHKDTTVVITNLGSLDLNITSKTFTGLNPEIFSFVTDGNPIILRGGQSETIVLRATGKLPIGNKNAQLVFTNNDPTNPKFAINLLANVRANVLVKSVEQIVFDTVVIGYSQDTTFYLKNTGDLPAEITSITLDGPFTSDFLLPNLIPSFTLLPGETKIINVQFKPTTIGLRYARLVINVNDPQTPQQFIILKGWGKNPNPIVDWGGGNGSQGDYEIDFGRVPIFETKYKELTIYNKSKYETLRIDSMYIDYIVKQPFAFDIQNFPFFISAGKFNNIILSFNPHDKVNSYVGYLNIYYSDSTLNPNKNQYVRIRMKGTVSFPTANVELTPVLKFGKVKKDESKTVEFMVTNLGETYLQMDSMVIIGEDKDEFVINNALFPIKLEFREEALIPVTFNPKKVGSKDAQIVIYWNDLFVSGNVEIWAECVVSNNQTVGVKSLEIPVSYDLKQNYPNPFNPTTRIEYSIPENSFVNIKVFNSIGQEVAELVKETLSPGIYYVDFDAKHLPSGVYFYRISTNKYTMLKKMLLLK